MLEHGKIFQQLNGAYYIMLKKTGLQMQRFLLVPSGLIEKALLLGGTCFEENISRKQNKISQLCRILNACA